MAMCKMHFLVIATLAWCLRSYTQEDQDVAGLLQFRSRARESVRGRLEATKVDNPFEANPPIPIFGKKCAQLPVITGAALTNYYQIVEGTYSPPRCRGWTQAILRMDGAAQGRQFDRFGAVWLSGVELLRTTTPEPTQGGITWQVLRDITKYIPILQQPGKMTLQIPTVLDSTYTGVLYINVSVDFYRAASRKSWRKLLQAPCPKRVVLPLRQGASPDIFALSVSGANSQVNLVKGLPRNIVRAHLEVFASAHGCEEFWYMNYPTGFVPPDGGYLGGCDSGTYREIDVYVDNMLAGLAYPFPVLYTGGLNPFLWHPLTGIASFNIPPYNFDLGPFLGILNDGCSHNVSIAVRDNNPAGVWYMDGVLHLELDRTVDVITGSIPSIVDFQPNVSTDITMNAEGNLTAWSTTGMRNASITGFIDHPRHGITWSKVQYNLHAVNNNTWPIEPNQETQLTTGVLQSEAKSSSLDQHGRIISTQTVISHYPFNFYRRWNEDNSSGNQTNIVNYSRHVHAAYKVFSNYKPAANFALANSNGINAMAFWNSTMHGAQFGSESKESTLLTLTVPCFEWELRAQNFVVTSDLPTPETCRWQRVPGGIYSCGLERCQQLDGIGRSPTSFLPSGPMKPQVGPQLPEGQQQQGQGSIFPFPLQRPGFKHFSP